MKIHTTLCIVYRDGQILLGMKKRGFGAGHWNGFGGKIEADEDSLESLKRELYEEAGVKAIDISKAGELQFTFEHDPKHIFVEVFRATQIEGELRESEEMKPQWFAIKDIPFDKMWPDDKVWFPHLLAGKNFYGQFLLDAPSSPTHTAKIIKHTLEVR